MENARRKGRWRKPGVSLPTFLERRSSIFRREPVLPVIRERYLTDALDFSRLPQAYSGKKKWNRCITSPPFFAIEPAITATKIGFGRITARSESALSERA